MDMPYGPPPPHKCAAPKRVVLEKRAKADTRGRGDATAVKTSATGLGKKPSDQWGDRPHQMFNMLEHNTTVVPLFFRWVAAWAPP